jgi:putative acetyltransferase
MASRRIAAVPARGEIRAGGLDSPAVEALLGEHMRDMHRHTPPESIHALDLEALRAPGISFWSMWGEGGLMGCGALKQLDPEHGEIKSMRTAAAYLRQGVARRMLEHIVAEARRRRYRRLSLETGAMAPFAPARRLYADFGFRDCAPFADYKPDPHSAYMTLELQSDDAPGAAAPGV